MISDIVYALLDIDTKTMISVLFWGSLVSGALVSSFKISNPHFKDKALSIYYISARFFQTVAYFLLFYRGQIPDFLSANLGNSFLFIGFYWEGRAMLALTQGEKPKSECCILIVTIFSLVLFNVAEFIFPGNPSLRVSLASICAFLTLFIPTVYLLFVRNLSLFKRVVGLFYVLFLSMLLPRAFVAFTSSISLLSNTLIQTLTFLSLVLLVIFSLPAYLLLMKEAADTIMYRMATTDALTGLANRQSFLFSAEMLFRRHKNGQSPLSVIFFDIDNFKNINDTFGHSFGDAVLTRFGEVLRGCLRAIDMACRYGGEEFVILLPRTDEAAALNIGHRVMSALENTSLEEHPEFRMTVSGGVHSFIPGEEDSLEGWIRKADKALYIAKENGKNRLVAYRDE